jgi:hypothetical protein
MVACMVALLVIFVVSGKDESITWPDDYNLTFWLETVMLLAFGVSWVVKGEIDQQVMNTNYFGNGVEESKEK